MDPNLAAVLGGLFVGTGAAAVVLMLRVYGKPIETKGRLATIRVHRALGWAYTLIYLVMMVAMVDKALGYAQLDGFHGVHMAIGTLIFPLLLTKILIVRFFTRLHNLLPVLGISVFSLGLVTVGMGVLPFLAATAGVKDTSGFTPEQLATEGETQVQARCTKCHDLDRVYDQKGKRSRELGESTLNRMIKLDPPLRDVREPILAYLRQELSAAPTPEGAMLIGASLLEARCQKCHALDRVYRYTKTKEDWLSTVRRYAELLPDHIRPEEVEPIANFLFEKRGKQSTKEDLQRQVFEKHCGACHNLSRATERAQESQISAKRWGRVVKRMARLYRERELPENKLWTPEEKQTITEYLASLYKEEPEGED